MRPETPFDPSHSRCIYPEFGRRFSEVMEQAGKRPIEIAKAIDVSPEIVRGYRRGFSHPSPQTQEKLERYFGVSLDTKDLRENRETISIPGNLTVKLDDSGDMIMSFRISPGELANFLGSIKC